MCLRRLCSLLSLCIIKWFHTFFDAMLSPRATDSRCCPSLRTNPKHSSSLHSSWTRVHSSWTRVHISWTRVHSSWTRVHSLWTQVHSSWTRVHRSWTQVHSSWTRSKLVSFSASWTAIIFSRPCHWFIQIRRNLRFDLDVFPTYSMRLFVAGAERGLSVHLTMGGRNLPSYPRSATVGRLGTVLRHHQTQFKCRWSLLQWLLLLIGFHPISQGAGARLLNDCCWGLIMSCSSTMCGRPLVWRARSHPGPSGSLCISLVLRGCMQRTHMHEISHIGKILWGNNGN